MDGIEVDRDGTRYGPYTPEEFLAYLASGHIAAGDRARIGARGGFEPVPVIAARIAGLPPSAAASAEPPATPAVDAHAGVEAVPPASPSAATPSSPSAAGFWRRAGAYAIDVGLVLAVWTVVSIAVPLALVAMSRIPGFAWMNSTSIGQAIGLVSIVVLVAAWAAYCAWQESSARQATLGKRLLGLVVVDRDGARLSFQRALGRHVAALLNWLTLAIGWLLAAVPPAKRGLHDHLAGTRVVCNPARAVSPWIGAAVWLLVGMLLVAGEVARQRLFALAF
jgi:uncharacterized RDD family membrane protein YckC